MAIEPPTLDVNENFGKVPDYIQQFRLKKEREEKEKLYMQFIIDTIPVGKRLVQEEERVSTLKDLYDAKRELIFALESYPIITYEVQRSPKMIKEKAELE